MELDRKRVAQELAPSASEAFKTAADECLRAAVAVENAARVTGEYPGGPRRRSRLLYYAAETAKDAIVRIELLLLDVRYGLEVIEAEREIDDFASRANRRRETRAA